MKFKEFKITEAPDLMTQYNQGGKKAMPAIKDLQTKLKAAGFDPNGIDGKYGPGTFKAVQAFQKANGLQADGQAGDSTLAKINTGPQQAAATKKTNVAPPPAKPTTANTTTANVSPPPAKPTTANTTTTPSQPANAAPTGGTQAQSPSTTPQTTQPASPAAATNTNANTAPATNTNTNTNTPAKPTGDPQPTTNTNNTNTNTPTTNTGDQTPTKAQDGGDASTYTIDGKPATRAEYEKRFGTDVSGRQNDVANLKARIQGSSKAAEDEKRKWEQAQLDDPNSKYYDGVPADPDDPSYPAELKAIDAKYAKQNAADQQKIKDLSSDPRVANNVKSDFDKALDGDDDAFGKSNMKDPFADDPEGDAAFDKALDGDDDFDKALDGDDDFDKALDSDDDINTNTSTSNTTSNSTSTSNVTRTGGTTTSVKQSGGGSTTRFASKYADNDESNKLKAQAKDIEDNQMNAFADQYDKNNPGAKRFDYTRSPEYKKLKQQARDLRKQARAAMTLVHPSGQVDVNGKTTYYGKGANKDGSWDGQQFQPTKETKLYFDIMKEMLK